MTDDADLSLKERKEYCLQKASELIAYVTDTLSMIDHLSDIPGDIAIDAEFFFKSVFGPDSDENREFEAYSGMSSSNDPDLRKKFLKKLFYSLSSAKRKLSAPEKMYLAYKWGCPDNLRKSNSHIDKRLGIRDTGSQFSKRILEFCLRIEKCYGHNCDDACAFYLRKILECSIVTKFEHDNRKSEIIEGDKIIGLQKLLNKSRVNDRGYLKNNVVDQLIKLDKIVLDESVHSLVYDPPKTDIESCLTIIGVALSQLKVNEL